MAPASDSIEVSLEIGKKRTVAAALQALAESRGYLFPLFSLPDARNLIRYGGMRPDRDVLQFDPALSYGLVEYLRILDMLKEHGWSPRRCLPHGGHQMALNLAAGLGLGGNESYPGVFQPFGGFADGIPVEAGYVRLADAPGVGFEAKAALFEVLRGVAE